MKRIVAIILVLVLTIALTACGNLSTPANGTYTSEGFITQTWTFSGRNEITMTTAGGLISSHGTYTISGDSLSITSSLFGVETTTRYRITEITSRSFYIDGVRFNKN